MIPREITDLGKGDDDSKSTGQEEDGSELLGQEEDRSNIWNQGMRSICMTDPYSARKAMRLVIIVCRGIHQPERTIQFLWNKEIAWLFPYYPISTPQFRGVHRISY